MPAGRLGRAGAERPNGPAGLVRRRHGRASRGIVAAGRRVGDRAGPRGRADVGLSVTADRAKWIWQQAAKRFKGRPTQWVVDVYHVMLYLHAAAAAGLGEKAAGQWVGDRVVELIEMGGPRFIEPLNTTGHTTGPPEPSAADGWDKLLNYLAENRDRRW